MKNLIIWIAILLVVGFGGYFLVQKINNDAAKVDNLIMEGEEMNESMATSTVSKLEESIGKSVEGRDIMAYHFGNLNQEGSKEVLFVGGIHGGYEWNTSLVAFEAVDYFKANPSVIPANVKVTVIPVLNPDGLFKTTGKVGRFVASDVPSDQALQIAGRFNAREVDLNRNFDCDWQATGKWQSKDVSGGSNVFSEPESVAIKNYIESSKPVGVVVWYSSAGGVYASNCHNSVSTGTRNLLNTFATASGYKAYDNFNFYEITGDMTNWLAKINIPAISVLLTNHTDTEWSKNQKGIDAVLKSFAQE